jgi:hypothetical protein
MAFKTSSRSKVSSSSAVSSSAPSTPPIIDRITVATDNTFGTLLDDQAVVSGGYILITGRNFDKTSNVYFNNVDITSNCKIIAPTLIQMTVPSISNGSYNLMVFNSANVGAVYTPVKVSGFPTWTTSGAYSGVTTVNIQLTATGDTPLTYYIQPGTSLPAGLTLSSSGVLSGTTTAGVYNLVLLVDDVQLQTSQLSLTLTLANNDPYFYETMLLLNGEGTAAANSATNSTFLDSSTNNFAVTLAGTTPQGTFSPFSPTGWSNWFDGSLGYQTMTPSSTFSPGTGNFTVEGWVHFNSISVGGIFQQGTSNFPNSVTNSIGLALNGSTNFQLYLANAQQVPSPAVAPVLNQWTHFAVVRNSGTTTFYVNGVSKLSIADSTNYTGTYLGLGAIYGTTGNNLSGYLSNFRWVNGVAVYTSNFTPSTDPLTAISGTSLLACQSNRFVDNSSNNNTISVYSGSVKVQPFSPSTTNLQYSPTTQGGSAYFDGSSSYLQMSQSAGSIGTSQFTIECWLYPTTWGDSVFIGDAYWYSGNNGGWFLSLASSTGYVSLSGSTGGYNSTSTFLTSTASVPLNQWNHFVCTRDGSNVIRMFINGVAAGTTTNGINLDSSYGPQGSPWSTILGARILDNNVYSRYTGFIGPTRIVVGTAVYTSNFTPPTTPPTAVTNTKLLLSCTNAGIIDQSSRNDLSTAGSASISTSIYKYGTGSIKFNGSTDYLTIISNPLLTFGTGNFTVEAWIYPTSLGSGLASQQIILNSQGTNSLSISVWNNNVHVAQFGVADLYNFSSSSVTNNAWFHLAICRSGTNLYCFVNGIQSGSTQTDSTNFAGTTSGFIGSGGAGQYFAGYIDDFRITKGYARYTGNFTPPGSAFLAL